MCREYPSGTSYSQSSICLLEINCYPLDMNSKNFSRPMCLDTKSEMFPIFDVT